MGYQDNPKQKLEQAVAALRSELPDSQGMQMAGERVWQRLAAETHSAAAAQVESIRGCGDVRALLIQYKAGEISPARSLLIRDHLQECPACRKEAGQKQAGTGLLPWNRELSRPRPNQFRRLVALTAAVALCAAIYWIQDRLATPGGSRAEVASVNGSLYLIGGTGERLLQPGQEIGEGERVRTAAGSRAMLHLRDGSLVEVNEHAEFSVGMRRRDTTINLERGDIIVQAAKRRAGHLYVAAQDCLVSVTGTVFAVDSGIKGSRVSVIQGEVRVTESGELRILHPGDQLSTSASVAPIPVEQEISWSQNSAQHLALLAELAHLQNKIGQTVQLPGLRYQSRILPLLPASTVLYAGVPNYTDAIQQAQQLFQQELQESDVLRNWWQAVQRGNRQGPGIETIMQQLHDLGQYLGSEIVFSMAITGNHPSPLVVAEAQKSGLKEFIQQLIAKAPGGAPELQVLDSQDLAHASGQPSRGGLVVLVRPDFVVVSPDMEAVQEFNNQLNRGGSGFSGTAFAQRVQQAYTEGAGLVLAANLQAMESQGEQSNLKHENVFQQSGFADLKYLVAERKDVGGQTINHAELTFNGTRHGFASWLAAPAPMGGLDFVSANAGAVGDMVLKSGGAEFDDVAAIAAINPNFEEDLAQSERETGINFKQDVADALGGELLVALDGPILPTLSWKAVVEVYDPARLQQTIEQFIAYANKNSSNGSVINLNRQTNGRITYYTVHLGGEAKIRELDYAFVDGYLILGPSQAMVMDSVQIHQSGNSLAKSAAFHALLPQDQFANVSAVLYQNLAPVLGPVSQQLAPGQLQAFKALAAETKPSVVCAYGQQDAIRVVSNSRLFGLDLNTLALSSLLRLTRPPKESRDHI